MQTIVIAAPAIRAPAVPLRAATLLAVVVALGAVALAPAGAGEGVDPDLVRVIRFMALLKGTFALTALCACLWRLGRAASPWRTAIYVAAPALMAGGALALWRMQAPGLAALGLHAGLFAWLAASLTDPGFWPNRLRRLQ